MKKLADYGIDHVGFVVKDREKAMEHFKELFGIDEYNVYDFFPTMVKSSGIEMNNYHLKIAMAKAVGKASRVEIIEPTGNPGCHQEWVDAGENGLHHICFRVDDYDYWRTYFVEKGAKFIFESLTEDTFGKRRCFYADDPEYGMVFEILEQPK